MSLRALVLLLFTLLVSFRADAAEFKIATVDFSRAINEIEEGKQAQARLDRMLQGKRAEIEQLEADIRALGQEYETKAPLLTDAAKAEYEKKLYDMQMRYQQLYAQADMDMQTAYASAMESLLAGLKVVAEEIGKERGLDLVLEVSSGAVLYSKNGTDITDEVIRRYNTKHPVGGATTAPKK